MLEPRATPWAMLVCLCLLLASPSFAAEPRPVTLDDFDRLEEIAQPALSPDGRYVAYTVRRTNTADDQKQSDLFLASLDGKERVQLTFTTKDNESYPRWSPDGKTLAFLSAREGEHGAQVWLLPRAGDEAQRLTEFKGGVEEFVWAPDGERARHLGHGPVPQHFSPEFHPRSPRTLPRVV